MSLFPLSLKQQTDNAREASGHSFMWHHIDTCLSCYLNDHHNREGELLLGVFVDGNSTVRDVLDGLKDEFRQFAYDLRADSLGYDHDKAAEALDRLIAENEEVWDKLFDSSLEYHSEDEFGEDYVQAWFLLTWDIPEEEDD
jgi:hypothetical protein